MYYIATLDADNQPRVRPFGTAHVFEGKLYIQTGRRKKVAQQILSNGKVELCAMRGQEWIRISGVLKEDPRLVAKESMLDAFPDLKKMYRADDDNTLVLYFSRGEATIYSFTNAPKVINF